MKVKKLIFLFFLTLLFTAVLSSSACAYDNVLITGRTPFAYEKITVTNAAAVGLNTTYTATAGAVFITVETANIRYRIDGTDPDADDGHLLVAASYQNLWFVDPQSIKLLRMISMGNESIVIVTYYRRN